jgi:hypothetical protein
MEEVSQRTIFGVPEALFFSNFHDVIFECFKEMKKCNVINE